MSRRVVDRRGTVAGGDAGEKKRKMWRYCIYFCNDIHNFFLQPHSFHCTSTAVLGSPRTHTTRAPCQALIPLPNASFIGRQGEFRNISFRCTSTAVFGSPRTCTSFACTTSRGSHRLRGLITREKQTSCRLTCLPGAGKRVDPSVHAESLRRGKRQSKVRQRKRWKSP